MTSNAAGLLAAVLDAPDDVQHRLVLADYWLTQGNPRGELVSVQCRLAGEGLPYDLREELKDRECELLRAHEAEWLDALGLGLGEGRHVAGFVEWVWVASERLAATGALLLHTPVRTLWIRGSNASLLDALDRAAVLPHLTALRLRGGSVGADAVRRLAVGTGFPRLVEVALPRTADLLAEDLSLLRQRFRVTAAR